MFLEVTPFVFHCEKLCTVHAGVYPKQIWDAVESKNGQIAVMLPLKVFIGAITAQQFINNCQKRIGDDIYIEWGDKSVSNRSRNIHMNTSSDTVKYISVLWSLNMQQHENATRKLSAS